MTKATPSAKIISLQIARGLLKTAGVLLLVGATFWTIMTLITPKGFHGGSDRSTWSVILIPSLMLIGGIGFLLPQRLANLLSSLLLVGEAVVLCRVDAYRWENWWIYFLFFVPLLLTLWLFKEDGGLPFRRLPNVN